MSWGEPWRPVTTPDIFPYGNVLTSYKYGHFKRMPMVVGTNREDYLNLGPTEQWPNGMTADEYINALQVKFTDLPYVKTYATLSYLNDEVLTIQRRLKIK